ncbi:MAG TPA: hypothetical protein VG273_25400 [Bryobacteraceae bacterium]|nr:hypothetical protein [Bryobacteraceae bacterium]
MLSDGTGTGSPVAAAEVDASAALKPSSCAVKSSALKLALVNAGIGSDAICAAGAVEVDTNTAAGIAG